MKLVYKNEASEIMAFAGAELTRYLERMGGEAAEGLTCRLETEEGHQDKECDAFRVRVSGKTIRLTGSNERSVLLAVYDYLHRLGCRFLMPGKDGEVIPSILPEQTDADYEKQASFYHRGVCIEGADSFENIMDYIDWLPKAGYNSFFLQFKSPYAFLSRWYHHEKNPYAEPEPYDEEDARRQLAVFEQEMRRRGLLLHKGGHGWTGEALGYESNTWETDTRDPGPEYISRAALVGGKRGLYRGAPANTNLCYSNREAADAFADRVLEYAGQNPGVAYLHIWLADEPNNICECGECARTTLSDQYVKLLNEIDRRLTAEGLKTRIVFLLYQELLWPPVRERLHNQDRFVLMFAPISRTFGESYRIGETADKLPEYHRNRITLPTELSENLAFLRGWQKIFKGDGFVYDYPLGRAHYGDFGYVHIARTIYEDIHKLRQLKLNGYISCQELRAAFPNALPNYMMGRALFDVDAEAEDIILEYFDAAYGRDAEEVSAYLTELSGLSSCDYVNGKGDRRDPDMAERMDRVCALCTEMEDKITRKKRSNGSWENVFWKNLEYHRRYIKLFAEALGLMARGYAEPADRAWEKMREFIGKEEARFQPYFDVYRILEVTQKYTGFCRSDADGLK